MRTGRSSRGWRGHLGVLGSAVVLGGLFLLGSVFSEPKPSTREVAVDAAVGAASCAALVLWRRRWPVAVALALIPAAVLSAVASGAVVLAFFSLAVHRSRWVAVAVPGVYVTAITVVYRIAIENTREYWETLVIFTALTAALVASGMLVRSQRQLVQSLRDRARQAEEGQRLRVAEARHLERERLAREMHDALAHRISLLAVHAGALQVRRTAPEEERQAAGVIRRSAYEALEDLREVIGMLRDDPDAPDSARPQPTLTDLPTLIEQSRRAGARVTLDNRIAEPGAAPAGIGRHVYRIVQEGLTNARKHAPGAPVRVTLDGEGTAGITVEITNALSPGAGTAEIPGAGTGLVGLRERVDLIGGRLEHGRTPGGDFRLRAWLPWRP